MYMAIRSTPSRKPPAPAIVKFERARHAFHLAETGSICADIRPSGEFAVQSCSPK